MMPRPSAKSSHKPQGIDARVLDLEQDPFPAHSGGYDLVVCWLYFQPNLYPQLRESIRPGGIAVLSVLLQGRFAAMPGELLSYFPDWTVLHEAATARTSEMIVQRRR
jgi:hypothetical protein